MICNRCKVEIEFDSAECCWWCLEYICYPCWDEFGHCGHVEADDYIKQARQVEQPKLRRAIAENTKAEKLNTTVQKLRELERPFSPKNKAKFDENGRLKF